jgi:hypothetical protein
MDGTTARSRSDMRTEQRLYFLIFIYNTVRTTHTNTLAFRNVYCSTSVNTLLCQHEFDPFSEESSNSWPNKVTLTE